MPYSRKIIKLDIQDHSSFLEENDFIELFKKEFVPLCSFCQYKYGFDIELAKDCVHVGFVRIWEKREKINDKGMVKAYLTEVINNVCLDIIKHEKVKKKHMRTMTNSLYSKSYTEVLSYLESRDLQKDIDNAIKELPNQMRMIFELCRFEGLKYAEVAQMLNISVKTVETQISRALVKLRYKLRHYLHSLIFFFFASLLNLF